MAMEISDFLAPSDVFVGISTSDKSRLLEDLCRRAASSQKTDADKITAGILKREELGSTGMGGGVAIPHARITDVKKPFGLLARLKSAIEFDSIDRHPVDRSRFSIAAADGLRRRAAQCTCHGGAQVERC